MEIKASATSVLLLILNSLIRHQHLTDAYKKKNGCEIVVNVFYFVRIYVQLLVIMVKCNLRLLNTTQYKKENKIFSIIKYEPFSLMFILHL